MVTTSLKNSGIAVIPTIRSSSDISLQAQGALKVTALQRGKTRAVLAVKRGFKRAYALNR